jgi:hypothetical protein
MRATLLFCMALGGCATTPAALAPAAAMATYTTVKQPKMIADCLQHRVGPVSAVREGDRSIITSRDEPHLTLRIYDNGNVQVWRPRPLEGQTRSAVESCV